MATMNPQENMAPANTAMPPDQPGIAVTITKEADGTYTVAPEMDEEATAPETGAMESQEASQGQTAKTMEEAFAMAKTMLEGGADGGMSVEQAFQSGFNGQPGKGSY